MLITLQEKPYQNSIQGTLKTQGIQVRIQPVAFAPQVLSTVSDYYQPIKLHPANETSPLPIKPHPCQLSANPGFKDRSHSTSRAEQ